MEAKEKAEELFNKYCYAIRTEETDSAYWTNIIYAKKCALIAVDETIEVINKYSIHSDCPEDATNEYWEQVKKEIKNL